MASIPMTSTNSMCVEFIGQLRFIEQDLDNCHQHGHQFLPLILHIPWQFAKPSLAVYGLHLLVAIKLGLEFRADIFLYYAKYFTDQINLVLIITLDDALGNKVFLAVFLLLAIVNQKHLQDRLPAI